MLPLNRKVIAAVGESVLQPSYNMCTQGNSAPCSVAVGKTYTVNWQYNLSSWLSWELLKHIVAKKIKSSPHNLLEQYLLSNRHTFDLGCDILPSKSDGYDRLITITKFVILRGFAFLSSHLITRLDGSSLSTNFHCLWVVVKKDLLAIDMHAYADSGFYSTISNQLPSQTWMNAPQSDSDALTVYIKLTVSSRAHHYRDFAECLLLVAYLIWDYRRHLLNYWYDCFRLQ